MKHAPCYSRHHGYTCFVSTHTHTLLPWNRAGFPAHTQCIAITLYVRTCEDGSPFSPPSTLCILLPYTRYMCTATVQLDKLHQTKPNPTFLFRASATTPHPPTRSWPSPIPRSVVGNTCTTCLSIGAHGVFFVFFAFVFLVRARWVTVCWVPRRVSC